MKLLVAAFLIFSTSAFAQHTEEHIEATLTGASKGCILKIFMDPIDESQYQNDKANPRSIYKLGDTEIRELLKAKGYSVLILKRLSGFNLNIKENYRLSFQIESKSRTKSNPINPFSKTSNPQVKTVVKVKLTKLNPKYIENHLFTKPYKKYLLRE